MPHRLVLEIYNTSFVKEISLDKIKKYETIYTQSGTVVSSDSL